MYEAEVTSEESIYSIGEDNKCIHNSDCFVGNCKYHFLSGSCNELSDGINDFSNMIYFVIFGIGINIFLIVITCICCIVRKI